jgi:hypothetical protein
MGRHPNPETPKKKSLRELMAESSEKYTEISINKARELAAQIIEDPEYRRQLLRRARFGVLPPQIETMLWYYLFGKPQENIQVNVTSNDDLENLTDEELVERAAELAELTLETKELNLSIKRKPTIN